MQPRKTRHSKERGGNVNKNIHTTGKKKKKKPTTERLEGQSTILVLVIKNKQKMWGKKTLKTQFKARQKRRFGKTRRETQKTPTWKSARQRREIEDTSVQDVPSRVTRERKARG